MRSMGLRWSYRHELLILAFVGVSALAFVYPVNWQDVSRLGLTQSLALRGSLRIDPYATQTGDKALFAHHSYSDKAPGISFAALPAFEGLRVVGAIGETEKTRGIWNHYFLLWLLRIATGGLLFLSAVLLVGRATEMVNPGVGGAAAATFGLGTLALPLAAVTFGHVGAGAAAFASFLLAWRAGEEADRRGILSFATGALAGVATLLEYQVAIIGGLVVAYLTVKTRRPTSPILFCLGVLPSLLTLGLYNDRAFGSPLHLSYRYTTFSHQTRGFFGVGVPSLHGLWDTLFAGKGLFTSSPVLLLAGGGLYLLWQGGHRAEAGLCAAATVSFVIYNAGYYAPYGGTSPGPRFLVPAIPFLALGLGQAYRRWPRVFSLTALLSVALMIHASATWNEQPAWTFVTIWSRWGGLSKVAGAALVCITAFIALALASASRNASRAGLETRRGSEPARQ
jgi:hypothetical protein